MLNILKLVKMYFILNRAGRAPLATSDSSIAHVATTHARIDKGNASVISDIPLTLEGQCPAECMASYWHCRGDINFGESFEVALVFEMLIPPPTTSLSQLLQKYFLTNSNVNCSLIRLRRPKFLILFSARFPEFHFSSWIIHLVGKAEKWAKMWKLIFLVVLSFNYFPRFLPL